MGHNGASLLWYQPQQPHCRCVRLPWRAKEARSVHYFTDTGYIELAYLTVLLAEAKFPFLYKEGAELVEMPEDHVPKSRKEVS